MNDSITKYDVRAFLKRFQSAIEADQDRVDALSPLDLPSAYDELMWRHYRNDHLSIILQLLASVDRMTAATLQLLTMVALSESPQAVGRVLLAVFAEAVTEISSREETAEDLFSEAIKKLPKPPRLVRYSARHAVDRWIPYIDPLGISQDPECGYTLVTH